MTALRTERNPHTPTPHQGCKHWSSLPRAPCRRGIELPEDMQLGSLHSNPGILSVFRQSDIFLTDGHWYWQQRHLTPIAIGFEDHKVP